jgi:hypothetical protein
MELSSFRDAAICAATREFPNILWNLKVYYCVQENQPPVPTLSQINPVNTAASYLSKIYFISKFLLQLS